MNERYDAVFDLHNNFRSRTLRNGLARNIHVIDKRVIHRSLLVWAHANYYGEVSPVPERYIETARKYDVRSDALGPELFLSDDVRGSARLKLRSTGWDFDAETIGICPGARHYTKRWPEEHVEALAGLLLERGYHLAVFGAETDSHIGDRLHRLYPARVHNCCGRLSLLETAAAMQHCHTLFTNDSGLMHMATAMEKPVVAIFGSTVREFGFFPYHQRSVVVEVEGLRCRPCTHIGRNDCPKGHLACLREISPEDVLAAFDSLRDPIPKQT
jgi:heptosyltransferase-2